MVPGPTTSDWATVLTNGNTSGASNPIIDAGQNLTFAASVIIPAGGVAPVASGTDVIEIGKSANTYSTNAMSVGVGAGVGASSANSTALGYGSIVQAFHPNSTALNGGTTSSANQIMAGTPSTALTVPGPLHFSTAGNISCDSGVDNINVFLGAGKTFYSDKTLTSLQQNGGAAHSSATETIAVGGPKVLVGQSWVADYSYDDSGATVVDTANYLIYLRKPSANYQVNMHLVVRSDIPPFTILVPHNATVYLEWADDGITPSTFAIGHGWFQPNANPANTEFSINISTTIRTTAAAGQWIQLSMNPPPIGRYSVQYYRLDAFLIN
jgi:hypothetical protein